MTPNHAALEKAISSLPAGEPGDLIDANRRMISETAITAYLTELSKTHAIAPIHIEYDNHHNAAMCPYCNPLLEQYAAKQQMKALLKARDIAEENLSHFRNSKKRVDNIRAAGAAKVCDDIDALISEIDGRNKADE